MQKIGKRGEEIAQEYLRKKGYRILEKNFRTRFGEIDIIAEYQRTIVFIEVKTRRNDAFGSPYESITTYKQQKIKKVALYYLKDFKKTFPVRFDVLSIEIRESEKPFIEHIEHAFS